MKGRHNQPQTTRHPEPRFELPDPDEPAIYAASLSDYNAGQLHGRWISANQDADDMQDQVDEMLATSNLIGREAVEEWAIHDYQGFGALAINEYERLQTIATLGHGIVEHGLVFADWANITGRDNVEHHDFNDHYRGHWPNLEAYAEELLNDFGANLDQLLKDEHSWLRPYVKLDLLALARDLAHDLETAEAEDGGLHIFDPPD